MRQQRFRGSRTRKCPSAPAPQTLRPNLHSNQKGRPSESLNLDFFSDMCAQIHADKPASATKRITSTATS
ncbi:hypothetical protein FHG87_008674 [Trinorchestia longiramus]|nr:hypothetical protein FHG87_008674 [Trinorchestia longiramus]